MAQDRIVSEVAGVVACSNDRGVKLVNGDGWVNFSKFAPAVTPPAMGATVVLGLDRSGYIREITLSPEKPTPQAQASVALSESPTGCPDKDVRITRMNVLGHAVTICATNGAADVADVADVLRVAAELERWVNRPC